ncbi:MAG TPA: S1/P1 nuclease [Sphingomonadaceae bacterium]|nr:S1/P1 nuclease [Sphingomonadaceae bacterium]
MMRLTKFVLSVAAPVAVLAAASPAGAWGPIGHRVSAEIAERNISGKTRAEIAGIMGTETLADASTWPDDERSNPDPFWQTEASPWHFVTQPEGARASALVHPAEGDAATALDRFAAVLRDKGASRDERQRALRFIVHIVADLHQPLHVGNGTDRGGNWFNVLWFDEPQNLHWVWDEGLILKRQLSYSEYAGRLERQMTPAEVIGWWNSDPAVWIDESAALRDRIYPPKGGELGEGTRESPVSLSWQYAWQWTPTMEQRLEQSGIRLAAYLDKLLGSVDQSGS